MKRIGILFSFFFSFALNAGFAPTELKAKVSAMWMSRSPYCGSPILVFTKSNVLAYDVLGFPTLGVLDNQDRSYDGSYYCLIFKLSEQFSFRADIDSGACSWSSPHTTDVCTASYTNTELGGPTTNCTSSADETVYLYLSTTSASNDPTVATQPFSPPTELDNSKGVKLNAPFVVRGNVSGRLVIDASNRINSTGANCVLSMPKFSFVNE